MDPISEQFVEKTWQQVADFTPARAKKEMLTMGKKQPDLLAFLTAYMDNLQLHVKELGIYIAFVVYKMLLDASSNIPRISSKEIMSRHDENTRFMESLEGVHEKIFNKIASVTVSKQPYVMKYVLEALMEDAEEDSIDLTDEDIGFLFLLLRQK